jgi:MOSC domain-containing protein YiiM
LRLQQEKQVANITSINISPKKGTFKQPVERAELRIDHGIVGDAHAGNWHRQISLLAQESIDKMTALGLSDLTPGKFAENITTQGISLYTLPVGTILRLGSCRVEVTQIGKECHQHCEIYKKVGQCIMPHEGIFVRVLTPGEIAVGDEVAVEA